MSTRCGFSRATTRAAVIGLLFTCAPPLHAEPPPASDPPPSVTPPQYAQPQYVQPQYAPSPYGQPQYAPPQYTQPQYPPPQYGAPVYAQLPYPYAPPKMKRNDTALYVIGLTAAILGGATALGGGITYMTVDYIQDAPSRRAVEATAVGLLIGGGALLAVGIPLAIIGGERVPATARIVPQPLPNGAGAAVALSY